MAVTRGGLEDRERDLTTSNRQAPPAPPAESEAPRAKTPATIFRERLAAARELVPAGGDRHWLVAWTSGRDAAVAVMSEGGHGSAPDRARALVAPADSLCRVCWAKGRDAAVSAMVD